MDFLFSVLRRNNLAVYIVNRLKYSAWETQYAREVACLFACLFCTHYSSLCLKSQEKESSLFTLLSRYNKWRWLVPLFCLLQRELDLRVFPSPLSPFASCTLSHFLCFYDPSSFHAYYLSVPLFLFPLCPLQCSPLRKAKRLIQKTESAWRFVVGAPLYLQTLCFSWWTCRLSSAFKLYPVHSDGDNNLLSVCFFWYSLFSIRLLRK